MRHLIHKQRSQGSALPICLILTGILSILAISALRSATAEARLSISVLAASQAFSLAERGVITALAFARTQPEKLSLTMPVVVPVPQPALPGHSIDVEIEASGNDNHCPMFANSERQHYEVYSTGIAGMSAIRTHVQGFYICRELCAEENCIGTELSPVPSYWTIFEDE
jgi:hypothetical protein